MNPWSIFHPLFEFGNGMDATVLIPIHSLERDASLGMHLIPTYPLGINYPG